MVRVVRQLTMCLGLMLGVGLAWPAAAQSCSASCVQALQSRGAPAWDVQRLCCAKTATSDNAVGQRCVAPKVTCIVLRPGPLGSTCYCAAASGPVPGQIRQ